MAARANLKAEITAILAVKLVLLAALWFAFFRGAAAPLDARAVARHALPAETNESQNGTAHDH